MLNTKFKVQNKDIPVLKPVRRKGDCIDRTSIRLGKYQLQAINFLRRNRGLVLAFSTGTGKTLTSIIASQCILDEYESKGKSLKVIVVVPKSLIGNYQKEMLKAGVFPSDPRYIFYTSTMFFNEYKKGNISCKNTLLIIDEAHKFKKNIKKTDIRSFRKTKVPNSGAMAVVACALSAEKVILLTATPAPNRIEDVLNAVAMVRGEFPLTKKELEDILYSDDKTFGRYFGCLFSFYDPKEDLSHYPDLEYKRVEIEMTPKYYKEYMKLERRIDTTIDPWAFYTGLRMGTNQITESLKADYTLSIIEDSSKIVVYSAFKSNGVELFEEEMNRRDIPYFKFTGETSLQEREEIIQEFNDPDSEKKVLFITNAGSLGLDLKGVRDVVLFESLWNNNEETQIIGRASRYDSHAHLPPDEQKVNVHRLLLVKPKTSKMFQLHPSADVIIEELSNTKKLQTDHLINRLKEFSINQKSCV